MGVCIVRLKEALRDNPRTFCDYRQCKLVIRGDMDVDWTPLDMLSTSILEILVPNDVLEARYSVSTADGPTEGGCLVQHDPQVGTRKTRQKKHDHIVSSNDLKTNGELSFIRKNEGFIDI